MHFRLHIRTRTTIVLFRKTTFDNSTTEEEKFVKNTYKGTRGALQATNYSTPKPAVCSMAIVTLATMTSYAWYGGRSMRLKLHGMAHKQ